MGSLTKPLHRHKNMQKHNYKRRSNYAKEWIQFIGSVAFIIICVYLIAVLFTLIGVVTGNIDTNDQSLTSQIIRETLK